MKELCIKLIESETFEDFKREINDNEKANSIFVSLVNYAIDKGLDNEDAEDVVRLMIDKKFADAFSENPSVIERTVDVNLLRSEDSDVVFDEMKYALNRSIVTHLLADDGDEEDVFNVFQQVCSDVKRLTVTLACSSKNVSNKSFNYLIDSMRSMFCDMLSERMLANVRAMNSKESIERLWTKHHNPLADIISKNL